MTVRRGGYHAHVPAAAKQPEGLVVETDLISQRQENELLQRFQTLRWDPIVIRGQAARRTAHHYGLSYDYGSRAPRPGEPISDWLEAPRLAVAALAGMRPEEFVEVLVQRYPSGAAIGWHRDAPAFGIVAGISVLGTARLRLACGRGDRRRTWEVKLERRSGYVLAGEARRFWQHSIPPVKELRYSLTFRTLC